MDKNKILKAGEIAKQVREWILPQIKKGDLLLDIAEKIENKIIELGGKPSFPCNLSINEIAAHYTPFHNDETKAHGLLKIDFGAHVEGWCSDQSVSIDLEDSEENKKLIQSSKEALDSAIETIKEDIPTSYIGNKIEESIKSKGFQPIINLTGHEIGEYNLHAGLTIPNNNNQSKDKIQKGLYAIEPFATLPQGSGKVKEGKSSGIYILEDPKKPRSSIAREVLGYIFKEYKTLPFCSRWLVKKFGTKALFALKQLEQNGNLHQFGQLIESSGNKIAQSEHTILIDNKGEKTITTR